jgi:hypothetical protein
MALRLGGLTWAILLTVLIFCLVISILLDPLKITGLSSDLQ